MLNNKKIFITGGTGSWGHELVKQIFENYSPAEVRIYSRGEHKQVEMKRYFSDKSELKFVIGDIRDKNILSMAMKDIDIVFHLAALKHVPICEENSWEAVLTNVYGTQNVIEAAIENKVKKVVDISTDKAVDPFNFYGVSKALGEKLIINANKNYFSNFCTSFVCIRGGNVMGTNGSVLPLFKKQILENNEITITDPNMTRYLMSTKDAIGLIFQAIESSIGGEIFVMRMPACTVQSMANVMIKLVGNKETKIKVIGTRPGEKMDEVLVSKNESPSTFVFNDMYYVVLPQYRDEMLMSKYSKLSKIEYDEFNSRNARQLDEEEFLQIVKRESWL